MKGLYGIERKADKEGENIHTFGKRFYKQYIKGFLKRICLYHTSTVGSELAVRMYYIQKIKRRLGQ